MQKEQPISRGVKLIVECLLYPKCFLMIQELAAKIFKHLNHIIKTNTLTLFIKEELRAYPSPKPTPLYGNTGM